MLVSQPGRQRNDVHLHAVLAGDACLLLGAVVLMPRLSQAAFSALPVPLGAPRLAPLVLALAQLRGAPGQAAVSLAAIVASFSLMAAMAIMVASFRESVDQWLDRVLPAEVYVRAARGGEAALDPAFEAGVRKLPQATGSRTGPAMGMALVLPFKSS